MKCDGKMKSSFLGSLFALASSIISPFHMVRTDMRPQAAVLHSRASLEVE